MGFTIPNDPAAGVNPATYAAQAGLDKVDFDVLVASSNATGVTSGCAVTAQGSPNMTVAVASGTVMVAGTAATVTGANVTITAADATNPRIDLVVSNNSGTLSATAGTAAASPCTPNIPANSVVLAEVYVPANITTIDSTRITDKRMGVRFDTTAPVTQAFGDAAATGTAAFSARRDHKHGMPSQTLTLIASSVLSGSAANVDFTSIPATYTHLRLLALIRSDRAAQETDGVTLRLNNDSGSNYDTQTDVMTNTTNSAAAAIAQTGVVFGAIIPAANATSTKAAMLDLLVPFYAQTTFHKIANLTVYYQDASTSNVRTDLIQFVWRNTAAVNEITLTSQNSANWVTGSSFYLYGMS